MVDSTRPPHTVHVCKLLGRACFFMPLWSFSIDSPQRNHLTEVCHDVLVEPDLQPLIGEILTNKTSNATQLLSERILGCTPREIEHSSFTPLIFSATGGMAKQSTTFYRSITSLLAVKWNQPYCSTLYWLHVLLSFTLLRSAIQCIRRVHSS